MVIHQGLDLVLLINNIAKIGGLTTSWQTMTYVQRAVFHFIDIILGYTRLKEFFIKMYRYCHIHLLSELICGDHDILSW